MRRACPAVLAVLSALAACSSAPPPLPPLALGERFAVAYEGAIAPLPRTADADADKGLVVALDDITPRGGRSVAAPPDTAAIRIWLVELAVDDPVATALRADAVPATTTAFCAAGAHVAPAELVAQVEAWINRANVLSAPFLVSEIGRPATLRTSQQSAAVAELRMVGRGGVIVVDPVVARYEHGMQVDLVVRRDGDAAHLTIAWSQQDLATPRTVAAVDGGRIGSLEVPVALQQKASASVKLAAHDALLFGPLPTTTSGRVQALALEIDVRKDGAATTNTQQ